MSFSPVHTWGLNSSLLSKFHQNRKAQQPLCYRRHTVTYEDTLNIHQAKLRISSVLLPYWSGRDTTPSLPTDNHALVIFKKLVKSYEHSVNRKMANYIGNDNV